MTGKGKTSRSRGTNDENQVTSVGGNSISYDDNGNVTVDDAGHNLVWDAWNRLVAVEDGSNNLIVGYVYDGLGRMTTFTNATTSTDLYYSGSQMLEQRVGVTDNTGAYVANGTVSVQTIYSPVYVNAVIKRDRDSDSNGSLDLHTYYTQDANYNVTAVISTGGSILQRMVYDAYGNVDFRNSGWSSGSDGYNTENLFQGGWRDQITGLYHFGARWYSGNLQWLSIDPNSNPYVDGMDAYIAMGDNPIDQTDPSGEDWHHLLTQSIFGSVEDLAAYGMKLAEDINIHAAEWGWIIDKSAHTSVGGLHSIKSVVGMTWQAYQRGLLKELEKEGVTVLDRPVLTKIVEDSKKAFQLVDGVKGTQATEPYVKAAAKDAKAFKVLGPVVLAIVAVHDACEAYGESRKAGNGVIMSSAVGLFGGMNGGLNPLPISVKDINDAGHELGAYAEELRKDIDWSKGAMNHGTGLSLDELMGK